jgi:DNA mismatch repair protein MutL
MGKIRRLSAELANQIAAGEVVERPASVVKELVENAVDAGAGRIAITIEMGGKTLIRVEDDGEGMEAEDARLAIERHATSKIARADDLERIATLGFRGEALPAVASVSHFVLRSRARGAAAGTEVRVDGGTVSSLRSIGMPEGTTVEVGDLFYNLPARRKFLKADSAEAAQVSRVATQLALCYPEIGFTLTGSGRLVLQCPPVATLRDRLFQLYGERADLVELRRESGDVRMWGFIAALAEPLGAQDGAAPRGPTRGPQHVFVNRRIVKDRTIAHAIVDAYSVASIKERSPEVHLFIQMPPDAVDVNVHPTKAEVRFRDQSFIHQLVRRAVTDTLGRGPAPELTLKPPVVSGPDPMTMLLPGTFGLEVGSGFNPGGASGFSRTGDVGSGVSRTDVPSDSPLRPMVPLGQFRDTFIIAVDAEGIAIVDQHVAHERVLFERIVERLTGGPLESQRLLDPLILELAAGSREALRAHAADLLRMGFDVEEFGGGAVRVAAYPALLRREECETALRALAEDLEGLDRGAAVGDALRRIAATMACHAAVKANDPLTSDKMVYILEELRRTAHSSICPHGRPVMLRLTRREIEKNFQRI